MDTNLKENNIMRSEPESLQVTRNQPGGGLNPNEVEIWLDRPKPK